MRTWRVLAQNLIAVLHRALSYLSIQGLLHRQLECRYSGYIWLALKRLTTYRYLLVLAIYMLTKHEIHAGNSNLPSGRSILTKQPFDSAFESKVIAVVLI
jgi:hypothetical protein